MASLTTSTCECYESECTKTSLKILRVQKGKKHKNAPGKAENGQNRVRFGCWRGWKRLRTGKTGWENPEFEPKRTPFPCNTCKKKTGRNAVFPPVLWQGQKDSNPRHAVLETAALPTELCPYGKTHSVNTLWVCAGADIQI